MAELPTCTASARPEEADAGKRVVESEAPSRTLGAIGLYDDVNTLLAAAARIRKAGVRKWDCHTPYPVHGLDRAMGLADSRIPYVTLGFGFLGLLVAIALTGGLSVFQYPIRIGGKPLFSWPAFVPIYFELFVLFAALATMASVVFFCRLGRWHSPLHDSGVMAAITRDRFAIVLYDHEEGHSQEELRRLLAETGCRDIRPLIEFVESEEHA